MKIIGRWHSERVEQEVALVRWGHFGAPVLLFPTAGGDAEEIERFLMIQVLAPLLDAGRIKIYSCDSVAGRAMVHQDGPPERRMWLQNQFHQYIRHEVVPAIRSDCRAPEVEVISAGSSIGAFHAVAVLCRFPDVFRRALGMSGTYDLRRFLKADHFTDDFWVSSPLHFLPTLAGPHLDSLRTRFVLLASGEGRAEDISESWAMARVLGDKGVPNRVDPWGTEWHHDWMTWRKMLPQYLEEWTKEGS
ncbi:MAG TPA: alpha/beta hydrolase-fold protein [Polyangia bacterium]|nr:alpha/beta hydrolase-fold protein [Polyangia bacterium]